MSTIIFTFSKTKKFKSFKPRRYVSLITLHKEINKMRRMLQLPEYDIVTTKSMSNSRHSNNHLVKERCANCNKALGHHSASANSCPKHDEVSPL